MNIRLCYASQYLSQENDLLEDLRVILIKARQFNAQQQICGVLYYAEGHFFQCLEGEEQAVSRLYQQISKDQRHQILKCFEIELIEQPSFAKWSMKYAKPTSKLLKFLASKKIARFQPQCIQQQDLAEFINLLLKADNLSIASAKIGTQRGYNNYF